MKRTLTCTILPAPVSYLIEIESGLLQDEKRLCDQLRPLGEKFVVITDHLVAVLYGHFLEKKLTQEGLQTLLLSFQAGEERKTRSTKEELEDRMVAAGCGRDTCVIALGGGVVTDLAGFIASTYCRGVPLITIPTSLMAMVDAAIGGKNGVNVPQGKNKIGSIYQPLKVWMDPSLLHTLPSQEFAQGIVEIIKHGLIADAAFVGFLEEEMDAILQRETPVLEQAIFTSCQLKKEIVEKDEKEHGKRVVLNFGHTVGHALEQITRYGLAHGDAVAVGLLMESYLATQLGSLSLSSFERIFRILNRSGCCLKWPHGISWERFQEAMREDKKAQKRAPRFVILKEIGEVQGCLFVEEPLIKKAFDWMENALRCD